MRRRVERFIVAVSLFLSVAFAVSCEKNEVVPVVGEDRVEFFVSEDGEEFLVVKSSIETPDLWPFDISPESLQIALQSVREPAKRTEFKIQYNEKDGRLYYTIFFPINQLPDDGEYIVESIRDGAGKTYLRKIIIGLQGKRMVSLGSADMSEEYGKFKGAGTEAEPFQLGTVMNFTTLAAVLDKDPYRAKGYFFELLADIDMEDYYKDPFRPMDQGWCGLGEFAGHFDGGGHTISNISHTGSDQSDIGLFKYLADGASVRNLVLDDVNIISANNNTGALVGTTKGSVVLENITVSGNVNAQGDNVGGLAGKVESGKLSISNCTLESGSVMGKSNCGGFVGGAVGSVLIENSLNDNMQVQASSSAAGGYVGAILEGSAGSAIMDSDCDANVYAPTMAGGVVGSSSDLIIGGVEIMAYKIAATANYCGGLVGYNSGKLAIDSCGVTHTSSENFKDDVVGTATATAVGGFVGYTGSSSSLTVGNKSKVSAPVSGREKVGGFVGEMAGGTLTISKSYNSNSSQLRGESQVGGFVGYSSGGKIVIGGDCEQRCNVVATNGLVGGVIGECSGADINALYLNGTVTGGGNYVGGIIGKGSKVSLKNMEFGSGVAVNGQAHVGGIAGRLEESKLDGELFAEDFKIKVCSNEDVKMSAEHVGGLCGSISKCEFRNITVKCSVYGKSYVGGFVGSNDVDGVFDKCSYWGDEVIAAGKDAGGIIGRSSSGSASLSNLTNNGTVSGPSHTGGIVGELLNDGLTGCTNTGTVSGGEDTGGIVGRIDNDENSEGGITINDCTNAATVTAGKRSLGGIAGYVDSGSDNSKTVTFSKCYNTGTVSGTGTGSGDRDGAGGIVGEGKYSLVIEYCANKGTVKATAGFHHIGGLVGYFGENSKGYDNYVYIKESYNSGTVEVTQSDANSTFVGGIAGHLEDSNTSSWNVHIKNCYNKGRIIAKTSQDRYHAGGIVGKASYYLAMEYCYNAGFVTSKCVGNTLYMAPGMAGCHADAETLFPDSRLNQLYIEKGSAYDDWNESLPLIIDWGSYFSNGDRSNKDSYKEFDFEKIWNIEEGKNGGYPYLRNNP